MRLQLAIALSAMIVACDVGDGSGDDSVDDFARGPVVLGLHDGAINHCDNAESWFGSNHALIFNTPGYPNFAATREELGDSAWWQPLDAGTVRVSVPWDIALPESASDAGLVIAHDPAGAWRIYHLGALGNEQVCFDYWLSAALAAHVTVNIAFKPDYDYRDPATNHILVPDIATYRTAIADFVSEYVDCGSNDGACIPHSHDNGGPGPSQVAQIHILTPWGEPDYGNSNYPKSSTDRATTCTVGCEGNSLPDGTITRAKEVFFMPGGSSRMDPNRARFDDPSCSQLTDDTCGPVLAAQMWMAIDHACTSCMLTSGPTANQPNSGIVAGDFSGGGGLDGGAVPGGNQSYVETYTQHLDNCDGCAGERPLTWGVHSYPDTADEEWCLHETGHDFDPTQRNSSTTERFLDALDAVGYHENTYVWLDEISVFATDNYTHGTAPGPLAVNGAACGVNTTGTKPTYTPSVEANALHWLVDTLPHVKGTKHPGKEPVVARVYYFRSFMGTDPDGDNITPTSPTANQQALYDAIVDR